MSVKKMILVDPMVLENESSHRRRPLDALLDGFQKQLKKVLAMTAPPARKVMLFNQVLDKFTKYNSRKFDYLSDVESVPKWAGDGFETSTITQEDDKAEKQIQTNSSDILKNSSSQTENKVPSVKGKIRVPSVKGKIRGVPKVSKTYRNKAGKLMVFMFENNFDITDSDEVILQGKRIKGSNVHKLFQFVLGHGAKKPKGADEFVDGLVSAGVPLSFFSAKQKKKLGMAAQRGKGRRRKTANKRKNAMCGGRKKRISKKKTKKNQKTYRKMRWAPKKF